MDDIAIYAGVALGAISIALSVAGLIARNKAKRANIGLIVVLSFTACMGFGICTLISISHDAILGDWSALLDTIQAWTVLVTTISVLCAFLNGISIIAIAKQS